MSEEQQEKHEHDHDGGMASRGVSRPMAEHKLHEHHQEMQKKKQKSGDQGMSKDDRMQMLHMHHKQTLWVYWTLILFGFWMIFAPATLGHDTGVSQPSGGRSIWLSDPARIAAITWSDIVSGILLVIFGWRALLPNRPVSIWICCIVGVWLNFAPLIFWAPTAASYLNDSLVGALVIALTVLVPGMPNMIMYMKMGPDVPPGWSYNPSSWPQRWIMIVTGFMGWIVSRYLAAFQLGYIDEVWDPFFGEGSRQVLNSKMSHMWPVSDAGLGAFSYTFEFLMGWMGSSSRWRTMPWMVTFFGILVIPLGLTHIFLVISQPVVVGAWCTFCLLAAAIMLPMIPLEVDEVIAMAQHMVRSKRKGVSLWTAFWKGGPAEGEGMDERSPALMKLPEEPVKVFKASVWGMSVPWTLGLSALIGLWLMFSPLVFGTQKPAAHIEHVGGALIITVSVICMGEVLRLGRYLNVLLGLVTAVLPWILTGSTMAGRVNDVLVGAAVIALAIPLGKVTEHYGGWDRFVK